MKGIKKVSKGPFIFFSEISMLQGPLPTDFIPSFRQPELVEGIKWHQRRGAGDKIIYAARPLPGGGLPLSGIATE